ncbi:MAG: 50S ribosomal protein L30 [Bacteroidota bacterium]|nr:50S ribosomal protein L30 [Bacteroidota bacterium]
MATIKIKQIKSGIDRPERQKRTLRALGFTKMNQTLEKEASPEIMGMVNKVAHLITIIK